MNKEQLFLEIDEIYSNYHGFDKGLLDQESENLIKELIEKAINYTRSCCKLKDNEPMTFNDWIKENNYRKVHKGYARNQIHFGDEEMLQRYNYYKRSL